MPEKDITEKTLESYEDVFADIANVLLFHGSPVIKENKLEDAVVRSHYKADGGIHEMERDAAKYWRNGNIRIAIAFAFAGLSEEQLKMFQKEASRLLSAVLTGRHSHESSHFVRGCS